MPSRISVMLTASSVAPSARTTSRSRSWVIGRAGRTPCCSNAIAAASTAPIQMGRYRSPCVSLSSRIGWFPGSSTRTPTTRSSCTVRLPQLQARGRADDRDWRGERRVWRAVGASVVRLRPVHGTPESGAQEIPEACLEQCGVQLRGQRRELPQLLGRPGPGLLRAGPQHRRDQLLDQPGLALAPRSGRPAGAAARCRAGPAPRRRGPPAGRAAGWRPSASVASRPNCTQSASCSGSSPAARANCSGVSGGTPARAVGGRRRRRRRPPRRRAPGRAAAPRGRAPRGAP